MTDWSEYNKKVRKEVKIGRLREQLEDARKATRERILYSLDMKLTPGGTNKLLRKLAIIVKEDIKKAYHKETR